MIDFVTEELESLLSVVKGHIRDRMLEGRPTEALYARHAAIEGALNDIHVDDIGRGVA